MSSEHPNGNPRYSEQTGEMVLSDLSGSERVSSMVFEDHSFAFTGAFNVWPSGKGGYAERVMRLGGFEHRDIMVSTDYLVVAKFASAMYGQVNRGGKHNYADRLRKEGFPIKTISEVDFAACLAKAEANWSGEDLSSREKPSLNASISAEDSIVLKRQTDKLASLLKQAWKALPYGSYRPQDATDAFEARWSHEMADEIDGLNDEIQSARYADDLGDLRRMGKEIHRYHWDNQIEALECSLEDHKETLKEANANAKEEAHEYYSEFLEDEIDAGVPLDEAKARAKERADNEIAFNIHKIHNQLLRDLLTKPKAKPVKRKGRGPASNKPTAWSVRKSDPAVPWVIFVLFIIVFVLAALVGA